jgi:excisionase family DNA binding protein
MTETWEARICRHVTNDGAVVVPGRIAAWLEQKAGVTADRRIRLRITDPEAYEVLAALHLAALHHGSDCGTKASVVQRNTEQSKVWMTTAEYAAEHHISDRAVRKAIAHQRLPATKHGGRWLIRRTDIHRLTA